jgi:hypothetical protein
MKRVIKKAWMKGTSKNCFFITHPIPLTEGLDGRALYSGKEGDNRYFLRFPGYKKPGSPDCFI